MNASIAQHRARKDAAIVAEIEGFSDSRSPITLRCTLGEQIRLNYSALQAYLFAELTPLDVDLLVVAGVVSYADRAVKRHRACGWSRRFSVSVPVHHPEHWTREHVASTLRHALRFLTGDEWNFDFVGRELDPALAQLKLNLLRPLESAPVVLPFSGGLDSFAMLKILSLDTIAIVVTAKQNLSHALLDETTQVVCRQHVRRASIPIDFNGLGHAEPTYRTRAFLFQVLAGIAARLSSASSIVIGENGQGSLGPALVPVGNEWPFRSTHPAFTARLAVFLHALYGVRIPIRHPHLWATKGNVLKNLKAQDLLAGWQQTRSCSRNMQRLQRTTEYVGCGVCGGCLLRRVAVNAAALPAEHYYWDILSADSLDRAVAVRFASKTNANDRNIAVHNILAMHNLSQLGESDSIRDQAAFELAGPLGSPDVEVRAKLDALLQSHHDEWRNFVGELPSSSWVAQLTAETP